MSVCATTLPPGRHADAWALGPAQPALRSGEVHVWRADLEAFEEGSCGLLSAAERARGERIVSQRARARWQRSRVVLRLLLARYLGCHPCEVELVIGAQGKPAVVGSALEFSLSHSGPHALYAFAVHTPVGVDVQALPTPGDQLRLAARALGPQAVRELAALSPEARPRVFAQRWARREARAKLLGGGLAATPATPATRGPAARVLDLELDTGIPAALATRRPAAALSLWRLEEVGVAPA